MHVIPVPTTKRKPLTKIQRRFIHDRDGGLCCRCGNWVDPRRTFIDEHIRALALGGTNDLSNRAPCHVECAEVKTREEDMPRIVKAKRQGAAVTSPDPAVPSKLQGRGFPKRDKKPRIDKPAINTLPPAPLMRGAR